MLPAKDWRDVRDRGMRNPGSRRCRRPPAGGAGFGIGVAWPAEHRRAGATAQALFERPQRIARLRVDDFQMRQIHARRLPRGCIRNVGRRDHDDGAAGLGHACQRREQQFQFAHAVGG